MSKSSVSCVTRTINLARQGNSLKERRTKLLIFERNGIQTKPPFVEPQLHSQLPVGLTICNKGKRLKVCTVADLKKTCPPKMCECQPKTPTSSGLRRFFGFGIKCLVAGGLVYWTYSIGLWGDASKTEKLYIDLRNFISRQDFRKPKDVGCVDESLYPPKLEKNFYTGIDSWNGFVSKAFGYITGIVNSFTDGRKKEVRPSTETTSETSGGSKKKVD